MAEVLDVHRIRVAGRDPGRLHRFVEEVAATVSLAVEAAPSAEDAVRGADIVVTVTSSPAPVLDRGWIAPGTHLNAVGSSTPASQEIDAATIAAARLFVNRGESTVHESGDYPVALAAGKIPGSGHVVAELGEVLAGRAEGRRSAEEITLFGSAAEDLTSARHLLAPATDAGAATSVEL